MTDATRYDRPVPPAARQPVSAGGCEHDWVFIRLDGVFHRACARCGALQVVHVIIPNNTTTRH